MSQPAIENTPVSTPGTSPSTPPAPVSTPAVNPDNVFTKADVEAAVEKARQQEKDKLYGKVSTLEERLAEVAQREEARQAAEEQARKDAEEVARKSREEDMSAKELLNQREQEWQERLNTTTQSFEARLAEIQTQREQEQALLEKERSFSALSAYKAERLAAESEHIAPQFHDFITGNSQEEIEQSIAVAKAKSAEVAEQVQAALQAARAGSRGTSVSGYAPVGPMEFEAGQRQYSAADIQNMDMAEYAKHRASLIGGGGPNNRGLFG